MITFTNELKKPAAYLKPSDVTVGSIIVEDGKKHYIHFGEDITFSRVFNLEKLKDESIAFAQCRIRVIPPSQYVVYSRIACPKTDFESFNKMKIGSLFRVDYDIGVKITAAGALLFVDAHEFRVKHFYPHRDADYHPIPGNLIIEERE